MIRRKLLAWALLLLAMPSLAFAQSSNIVGLPTAPAPVYVPGTQAYTAGSIWNLPITASFVGSTTTTVLTVSSVNPGQAIAVGQTLYGTAIQVTGGTTITGSATSNPTGCSPNCTGAGGVGTYAISASQSRAAQLMNATTNTYSGALAWPASTGFNYGAIQPTTLDFPGPGAPTVTLTGPSTWGWPACSPCTLQIDKGVTGGANVCGVGGVDNKAAVVNGNIVWSFEDLCRVDDTHATYADYALSNILTETGFGNPSPFKGAGTTATGSTDFYNVITAADVQNGVIPHKLGLVLLVSLCSPGALPPAISSDCSSGSGILQEGAIVGLVPTLEICPGSVASTPPANCVSGLSSIGRMLFTSFQTYGVFVNDRGGENGIGVDTAIGPAANSAISRDLSILIPLLQKVN